MSTSTSEDTAAQESSESFPLSVFLCCAVLVIALYCLLHWAETKWNGSPNEYSHSHNNNINRPTVEKNTSDQRDELRSDFVDLNLKIRIWSMNNCHSESCDEDSSATQLSLESAGDDIASVNTMDNLRQQPELRPSESSSAGTCVICVASFQPHDLVCESNRSDCTHLFHASCMQTWLKQHNECPICRALYLDYEV